MPSQGQNIARRHSCQPNILSLNHIIRNTILLGDKHHCLGLVLLAMYTLFGSGSCRHALHQHNLIFHLNAIGNHLVIVLGLPIIHINKTPLDRRFCVQRVWVKCQKLHALVMLLKQRRLKIFNLQVRLGPG